MRILHTADWHLGRKLGRVDRIDEQAALLGDLVERTRELDPHVVVIAGDVFDFYTPTAQAERLYYRTLRRLSDGGERAVLVVAGNHDSGARLTAPRGLLGDAGVVVAGAPHSDEEVPRPRAFDGFTLEDAGPGWVTLSFPDGQGARFHLLPFPARSRLPQRHQGQAEIGAIVAALQDELPPYDGDTFLVSHLYVRAGHDVDEDRDDFVGGAYAVDASALAPYTASFLGHLHRPHGDQAWRYAGAPMRFDFDDPQVDRGAWLWQDGSFKQVPLEAGRDLVEREVQDVDHALSLAEEDDAWTRLRFEAGTVLAPNEREKVRQAYGARLVDIQFQVPESQGPRWEGSALGSIDPEEAFRAYVAEEAGGEADDELVNLFLDLLQDGEAP